MHLIRLSVHHIAKGVARAVDLLAGELQWQQERRSSGLEETLYGM